MDNTNFPSVAPMQVAIISGTGDGGSPLTSGTLAKTPDHQPNLVVTVLSPIAAMAIRFTNAYLTTLVGLVTVGLTSDAIPASDFGALVWRCAGLSLAGPAVSFLKDLITILTKLENKWPLWTGNV